ncbi:Uncharacterised protein [Mycobacteroides abscessus]|nr:Uncharacterised protein [Mycobacteroides abscessus]
MNNTIMRLGGVDASARTAIAISGKTASSGVARLRHADQVIYPLTTVK